MLREMLETVRELRAYWRHRPGEVYRAKQRLRAAGVPVPLPDRDVGGAAFPRDVDLDATVDSARVTPADGNLFADIGFGEDEAAALLAQADAAVAPNVSRPRVRARRRE